MSILLDPIRTAVVTVRVGLPAERSIGADLAVRAQAATGFPVHIDPLDLHDHFMVRQRAALTTWLAFLGDQSGEPVGVGLVERVAPGQRKWAAVTDPAVATARDSGTLVEFGGLAVAPEHQGGGVATALVRARLAWSRRNGFLACTSVWDINTQSQRLANRFARPIGPNPDLPATLYVYEPIADGDTGVDAGVDAA